MTFAAMTLSEDFNKKILSVLVSYGFNIDNYEKNIAEEPNKVSKKVIYFILLHSKGFGSRSKEMEVK